MDILLIGGPKFLGKALTDVIIANGHTLTYFNRGKTNTHLFPEIKRIIGDRDGEVYKLGDHKWDLVIDTCGYIPRIVKKSVDYLKDKTKQYLFISTISVYEDNIVPFGDESAKLIDLEDKTTEDIMGGPQNYGGLKVLCENEVLNTFGNNAIIVRPGLIVGPYDPTNRFTYWPIRIKKGGKTIAPGDGTGYSQIIDVRDLAEFCIKLAEKQTTGIFNVAGPEKPYQLKELFEQLIKIQNSDTELIWIEDQWLLDNDVKIWMEIPLWAPSLEFQASMQINIKKSLKEGLKFRPLKQIVFGILKWYDEINGDSEDWPAGLDYEKEIQLLEKYQNDS